MAGMDPMRFLESEDPVETMVMSVIAQRWFDRKKEMDEQLASMIINTLGKSMKSGG